MSLPVNIFEQIDRDTEAAATDPFYPNVHKVICDHLSNPFASKVALNDDVYAVTLAIHNVIATRAFQILFHGQKIHDNTSVRSELLDIVTKHSLAYMTKVDIAIVTVGLITAFLASLRCMSVGIPFGIVSVAWSILAGSLACLGLIYASLAWYKRPWSHTFRCAHGNYHVYKARCFYNRLIRRVVDTNCIEHPWKTHAYLIHRADMAVAEFRRRHPDMASTKRLPPVEG